jgi:hypothetical protein
MPEEKTGYSRNPDYESVTTAKVDGPATTGYGVLDNAGKLEQERLDDNSRVEAADATSPSGDTDVYLIAGQSNTYGSGGDASQAPSVSSGFANVYRPPVSSSLIDPANSSNEEIVGTIVPSMVNTLNNALGRDVLVVNAGIGGTSLDPDADDNNNGNWDPDDGSLHDQSVTWTNEAINKSSGDTTVQGIIWIQGTKDTDGFNQGVTTKAEYRDRLKDVIDTYRDDFDDPHLPMYIAPTMYRDTNASFRAISSAQMAVAASHHNIICVDNTASMGPDRRDLTVASDNVHYNQTGLNELGEAMGREMVKTLAGDVRSRLPGGDSFEVNNYTGAVREATVNVDASDIHVHDGRTEGGFPLSGVKARYEVDGRTGVGSGTRKALNVFNTFDPLGIRTNSNQYTAPADGIYSIVVCLKIDPSSVGTGQIEIFDQDNATAINDIEWRVEDTAQQRLSPKHELLNLNRGDTIAINFKNNSGGSLDIIGGTRESWIQIER